MKKVIIDVDTGIDDAQALLLALRHPELDVLGITCVNGNVQLNQVVINTLKAVEASDRQIPVYAGASQALLPEKSENAPHIHGTDGLGDLGFPNSKLNHGKQNAVQFLVDTITSSEEKIEVIALAPLTNIALAFRQEPEIIKKIDTLIMMAGAVDFGNTRPMSEFNVFADPEAAKIVIDSKVKKILVPLDPLWHGGQINKEEIDLIQNEENKPWCKMAAKLMMRTNEMAAGSRRKYAMGEGAVAPPDLLTVALSIDPFLGEYEELQVFVETTGQYTRGMTMFDRRWNRNFIPGANENQALVFLRINQKRYGDLVVRTLTDHL